MTDFRRIGKAMMPDFNRFGKLIIPQISRTGKAIISQINGVGKTLNLTSWKFSMKSGIRNQLTIAFGVMVILTVIVAYIGYSSANSINTTLDTMYNNQTQSISYIKQANIDIYGIRVAIRQAMLDTDKSSVKSDLRKISDGDVLVQSDLAQFQKLIVSDDVRTSFNGLQTAYTSYFGEITGKVIPLLSTNHITKAELAMNNASTFANQVDQYTSALVSLKNQQANDYYLSSGRTVAQGRILILIFAVFAVLVGLGITIFMSGRIAKPLGTVAKLSLNIGVGNLNRQVDQHIKTKIASQKDETGEVGKGLLAIENYLQDMVAVAGRIAEGDLTVQVNPRSDEDELGLAFARMVANLRQSVGRILESASGLGEASQLLANTSVQAGEATGQIAATIQQVAQGTAQQTASVTKTAASVEQMSRAIDGVARGAQDQSQAVAKVSAITAQLNKAVEQVAANALAGRQGSKMAAQVAQDGALQVNATIAGMQTIKVKVGVSAEKVKEMGAHSEQIGVIAELIHDIASQTNLLALNAAIEAARAGENGRGFAVVAVEVRKLAERSSGAIKEIAGLIKGIQVTTAEAVKAMEEGAREVEQGVREANSSGQSLTEILKAAVEVSRQVDQIAQAAQNMQGLSKELEEATDSVGAVVEENTAATEEMTAGSSEVNESIENIASVGEQNSAAVEQVAAASEEMSSQVEEVSASAQSLAEMALNLKEVVAQFRLN